ncbi:hypothetical protein LLG95_18605 [bacterium]|nr:hypothetical protein [bacterium]
MPHIQSHTYSGMKRRILPALRPIRSDGELDAAVDLAEKLEMEADSGRMSRDRADYLEVLAMLIERYEDEHHPIRELPTVHARLKALTEAAGMNASDLGRLLGNRALGNKLLRGEREPSKTHIRRLAEHFSIDPGFFI